MVVEVYCSLLFEFRSVWFYKYYDWVVSICSTLLACVHIHFDSHWLQVKVSFSIQVLFMIPRSLFNISLFVFNYLSSVFPIALISIIVRAHVSDTVLERLDAQKVIRNVKLLHQFRKVFTVFFFKFNLLFVSVDFVLQGHRPNF